MANGGKGRVLYVLPHKGFWYPDYEGVARALAEHDVEMVVASSKGEVASLHRPNKGNPDRHDRQSAYTT